MADKRKNPNKSPWRFITEEDKRYLAWRYKNKLHIELGEMKQTTLERRVREYIDETNFTVEDVNEGFKIKEKMSDINHSEVTSTDKRITTVEELLKFCDIDLEEWSLERAVVNKYETPRKDVKKHIIWKDSSIQEGYVEDTGGMFVQQLIQVKAWLIRRKPLPIYPVVSPVQTVITKRDRVSKPQRTDRDIFTALIVPDTHFGFSKDLYDGVLEPFHSRNALSIALDIAHVYNLNKIIFLGDTLDLPDWSDKFLRAPEFMHTTQPSIVEAAWWFAQFRAAAPEAEISVLEGNHDIRFRNSIIKHIAAGYGLRPAQEMDLPPSWSIPRLLGLHTMDINWVGDYPNNSVWINETLKAVHGNVTGQPGQTAHKVIKDSDVSIIFGHIHRAEMSIKTIFGKGGSKNIVGYSPGTACRVDGIVPGVKKDQQWSLGLALVNYNHYESNISHISVNEGNAMVNGDWFTNEHAVMNLEQLREETAHHEFRFQY